MMREINRDNYEAYFLDSLEGNLSQEDQTALDQFLEANLELKVELEDFDLIYLDSTEDLPQMPKEQLLKEEKTKLNRQDYLMISSVEGTITSRESEELTTLLDQQPKLVKEHQLYQKTKLKAPTVSFQAKEDLKRKAGKVIYWQFYRIATSVAACLLAFFLFNLESPEQQYKVASIETQQINVEQAKPTFSYVIEEELEKEKAEPKLLNSAPIMNTSALAQAKADPEVIQKTTTPKVIEPAFENSSLAQLEDKNVNEESVKPKNVDKTETDIKEPTFEKSTPSAEEFAEASSSNANQEQSISDYASDYFKKEVLKDKSLSETISDELASLTNDKVQITASNQTKGKGLQYAFNIGNFKVERK